MTTRAKGENCCFCATEVTLYAERYFYKGTSARARKFSLLPHETAYGCGTTIPLL